MAVNKGEIGIYGILVRDGGDNILAKAEQIKDEKYGEKNSKGEVITLQQDINADLLAKVGSGSASTLEDAKKYTNEQLTTHNNNADAHAAMLATLKKASISSATGQPIISVSQENGIVDATVGNIEDSAVNFTAISGSGTTVGIKGPTVEKALASLGESVQSVYNELTSTIMDLDAGPIGGDGKYIQLVQQTDGKLSATAQNLNATNVTFTDHASASGSVEVVGKTVDEAITSLASSIKTVSATAGQAQNNLNNHLSDTNNPHKVTKAQINLGNVTNDAQVKRTEMGAANGVATLDENGLVPSTQLPSYVDDVIEGYYYNSKFYKESAHTTEITAESGKIYVDLTTNKTYRWGGTTYVVISETLALGTTSTTAYYGDKGQQAYERANSIFDSTLSYFPATLSELVTKDTNSFKIKFYNYKGSSTGNKWAQDGSGGVITIPEYDSQNAGLWSTAVRDKFVDAYITPVSTKVTQIYSKKVSQVKSVTASATDATIDITNYGSNASWASGTDTTVTIPAFSDSAAGLYTPAEYKRINTEIDAKVTKDDNKDLVAKTEIEKLASLALPDKEMSETSTNTVQNKAVYAKIKEINEVLRGNFAKIAFNVSPTTIERGVSTKISMSWAYNYNGTTTKITSPDTMQLLSGSTVLADTGTTTYSENISEAKSYQVKATVDGVNTYSSTVTVRAYYPMYFGECGETFSSATLFVAANKQSIRSSAATSSVNVTFTGKKYLWLCIPTGVSGVNSVKSSGFSVPMEAGASQTVNGIAYTCYRSTDTVNAGTVNYAIS